MKKTYLLGVLLWGAGIFCAETALAASCCGGGSASSLILPKISKAMADVSFDVENYDGYWDKGGMHNPDPAGSKFSQYRLNLGYGLRLADRWQASVSVPFVHNSNRYSSGTRETTDMGDTAVSLWYENFDDIQCVWNVRSAKDLIPATYFGATLTLPTGVSPYDDIKQTEDVTGRGFYRLDGTMLLDKTIYPINVSLLLSYGIHRERPVNRINGNYEPPTRKKLGDRFLGTLSLGYTHFLESMDSLTFTAAYSDLHEGEEEIDGSENPASGMRKKSLAGTIAFSTMDRNWIFKATWNHALEGENFPKTDIFTLGVSHVFR